MARSLDRDRHVELEAGGEGFEDGFTGVAAPGFFEDAVEVGVDGEAGAAEFGGDFAAAVADLGEFEDAGFHWRQGKARRMEAFPRGQRGWRIVLGKEVATGLRAGVEVFSFVGCHLPNPLAG